MERWNVTNIMNMHMLTAIQNVKNLPKHVMREELGSGTSFIGVLILSERRRWPTSKLENVPASRTATMVVKLGSLQYIHSSR